jgi:hypothetical protein
MASNSPESAVLVVVARSNSWVWGAVVGAAAGVAAGPHALAVSIITRPNRASRFVVHLMKGLLIA